MKRKIFLLAISILILGCSNQNINNGKINNKKIVKLSSGKTIKVKLEIKEIEDGAKGLLIEYKNDEKIVKVKTLENEILEIWKVVEEDANKLELKEGVIKYSYLIGKTKDTNEPVYEEKLFSAEKIENGTWKIRKVN
ncbi:MAG: hypothetical protein ACR2J3_10375 [Aridibacter sp.]